MAIYTTTQPTTTPVSTRIVLMLGLVFVGVGVVWAINDQIRSAKPATEPAKLPSTALPGTLPSFDHILQYVSLLVVGVCVAGFLVAARAIFKMR
jgi:hypothetical protein